MDSLAQEARFVVYKYLQESGFWQAARYFSIESGIRQPNIDGALVPRGALLSIIEKGLQYTKSEIGLAGDGTEIGQESLSLIDAVRPEVVESRKQAAKARVMAQSANTNREDVSLAASNKHDPMGIEGGVEIPRNKTRALGGHTSQVRICAWNPVNDLLASGSDDSTTRIWDMNDIPSNDNRVLTHAAKNHERNKVNLEITSVDWNFDGTMLATGCSDGYPRLWSLDGLFLNKCKGHMGSISALKWNKGGSYILSAALDWKTIVWDAMYGLCVQQFAFHEGPVLDVDWLNDTTFASCSTDMRIHVCQVGMDRPCKTLQGHTSEVNAIQWDSQGSLLASCSDDRTVKIWDMNKDKCVCDLRAHSTGVYRIKWSPTGAGTNSPNAPVVLASASFDSTVRLWDVNQTSCLHTLRHGGAVRSVAFSPEGKYLASGSTDKRVYIWDAQSGTLVHSYNGTDCISDVCWNQSGEKVAASSTDGCVFVLDLRK